MWRVPLAGPGLGGIAATREFVVFGDRDLDGRGDEFRCLDAKTGALVWRLTYPAPGKLDYGNTPRATPLIHGDLVYLLGAFGDLHCVKVRTGEVAWLGNLCLDFGVESKLVWGICSSPLIAEGRLILNPGGELASLVGLVPATGEVAWETPGAAHAFASFLCGTFGGVRQVVGYDRTSLGGWDPRTGRRLWTLTPPIEGDFNVPTPVDAGGRLLVTTENNGTRLYEFADGGEICPNPVAVNEELAPDMSTPVVVGERAFCVWKELFCLDLADGLKTLWKLSDGQLSNYGAVVASDRRLLVFADGGQLLLAGVGERETGWISRLRLPEMGGGEPYSHPAIVGDRLFLRGERGIVCLLLAEN